MARTANRGTISASAPTSYNAMRWRLGKYIRLSKEDLLRGRDESNSVINQRRLLEQYHQTHLDEFHDGTEQDVYVDDGKTGTDTDREDFQRLLADVYSGRINCVIVKDLSRLSRNYTDARNLIECTVYQLGRGCGQLPQPGQRIKHYRADHECNERSILLPNLKENPAGI